MIIVIVVEICNKHAWTLFQTDTSTVCGGAVLRLRDGAPRRWATVDVLRHVQRWPLQDTPLAKHSLHTELLHVRGNGQYKKLIKNLSQTVIVHSCYLSVTWYVIHQLKWNFIVRDKNKRKSIRMSKIATAVLYWSCHYLSVETPPLPVVLV